MEAFLAILSPVLMLFTCMVIGFALRKTNTVSNEAATTLAKLENWVFCPSLAFMSMAATFTPQSIASHSTNLAFALILVFLAMGIGISLSYLFVREKCYERSVYQYALVFANLGYMADPLVQGLFGDAVLGSYKFFCLPFTIVIYIWGINILTPDTEDKSFSLKRIINMPTIFLLLGVLAGLTGALEYIPDFIIKTLNSLKVCMGPVAMLIAGITIAKFDVKKLLLNKKVYVASLFRLIILPVILVGFVIGLRAFICGTLGFTASAEPIYFAFFALAMPLGMNTVVFPEAFGGDPEPGASMALISSAFSIITVPLLYMLLNVLVPVPF